MRSPAAMDILVIDITNRCFLACSNCTRLISHQSKTREMDPDYFRLALQSIKAWYQPGRVVGLIGGEPTLHSQFDQLCQILREEWNPGQDPQHGREPIADVNAFATQRLYDRTNGRGLWTSFGPRFTKHYEVVMDTFSHWNPNDHTGGGKHQTGLVDAREMCASLGIDWKEWPKYRDNCWVQNTWSASITPQGAYFCEYAGQLDLLYNGGRHAWPLTPDWWKKTPEQFGDQLQLCEMCSLCLPGPSQVDALDRDILSDQHRQRLLDVGSPAVRGGRYELYDSQKHQEQRTVCTKDSYVEGPRVSAVNQYLLPKKLSAVIVCVGYADKLQQTLAHNAKQVDELVVVTTLEDVDTQLIAQCGAKLVQSNRCFDDGHAFNKGKMLNDGLAALVDPDWIVFTDADCYLHANLLDFVKSHALNPGCLYGTDRVSVNHDLDETPNKLNHEHNGYFQLFHKDAKSLPGKWPKILSENFCSAGGIDSWFLQQWPAKKRLTIPEVPVIHIEHGELGANWNGLGSRPGWKQFGIITPNGVLTMDGDIDWREHRLKMTDTLHGNTAEIDYPVRGVFDRDLLRFEEKKGLVFLGREIGSHHIHLAYWDESP